MMKSFFQKITNIILPNVCVLCMHPTHSSLVLCDACKIDLPWLINACMRCANPLPVEEKVCGECLKKPPPYDNTFAMLHYKKPITNLIAQMKYQQQLSIAKLFGEYMAEKLINKVDDSTLILPQAILPVPLHTKRLRERGFNQAIELARPVAKRLQLPILTQECIRIRATEKQSLTRAGAREDNIKNAFSAEFTQPVMHVALIDDVITTGNTISAVSKSLKKAGVQRIDVWCVARTQLHTTKTMP